MTALGAANRFDPIVDFLRSKSPSVELAQYAWSIVKERGPTSDGWRLGADQPAEVRAAALRWTSSNHLAQVWTACEDDDPFIAAGRPSGIGTAGGGRWRSRPVPAAGSAATGGAPGAARLVATAGASAFAIAGRCRSERALRGSAMGRRGNAVGLSQRAQEGAAGGAHVGRVVRGVSCRNREVRGRWRPGSERAEFRTICSGNSGRFAVRRAKHGAGRCAFCGPITRCSASTFCVAPSTATTSSSSVRRFARLPPAPTPSGRHCLPKSLATPSDHHRYAPTRRLGCPESKAICSSSWPAATNRWSGAKRCARLAGAVLDARQRTSLESITHGDPQQEQLIARVLDPQFAANRPISDDLDAWVQLLDGPANADEGQRIFHSRVAGCARCHTFDGRGGRIGPDLSAVGRALDRRRLIDSILRPSKEIAPQFVTWAIETTGGQLLSGLLVGESADGVQKYVDFRGESFALPARCDRSADAAIAFVDARRFGTPANGRRVSRPAGVSQARGSAGRNEALTRAEQQAMDQCALNRLEDFRKVERLLRDAARLVADGVTGCSLRVAVQRPHRDPPDPLLLGKRGHLLARRLRRTLRSCRRSGRSSA